MARRLRSLDMERVCTYRYQCLQGEIAAHSFDVAGVPILFRESMLALALATSA